MSVGKISNNLFHRFGQFTHEGRDRNDLVTASQLGLAQQIDNLDVVLSRHVLFAKGAEIIKRGHGFGALARHIQPQLPWRTRWAGLFGITR